MDSRAADALRDGTCGCASGRNLWMRFGTQARIRIQIQILTSSFRPISSSTEAAGVDLISEVTLATRVRGFLKHGLPLRGNAGRSSGSFRRFFPDCMASRFFLLISGILANSDMRDMVVMIGFTVAVQNRRGFERLSRVNGYIQA